MPIFILFQNKTEGTPILKLAMVKRFRYTYHRYTYHRYTYHMHTIGRTGPQYVYRIEGLIRILLFVQVWMIKYCFHNLEICQKIYKMYLLPWAAHMAKNWKSISEICLRHPLFYLLHVYCLFGTTVLFWNSLVGLFI